MDLLCVHSEQHEGPCTEHLCVESRQRWTGAFGRDSSNKGRRQEREDRRDLSFCRVLVTKVKGDWTEYHFFKSFTRRVAHKEEEERLKEVVHNMWVLRLTSVERCMV